MVNSNSVPEVEEKIYDQAIEIRAQLSAKKKDRTQYLNSKDVLTQYKEVLELVKKLNIIRKGQPEDTPGNKVDQILDDVFQILSLFFITVGLTKTAPATYASLTTVQRLLEHLNESKVFTKEDLLPIKTRLKEIDELINSKGSGHDQDEFFLLKKKLNDCIHDLNDLESKIDQIDPELYAINIKLVHIRTSLLSLASRPERFNKITLENLKNQILELSSHRDSNGKFLTKNGEVKEDGQSLLNGLLDDCNNSIADLEVSGFKFNESLNPLYQQLTLIKSQLEDLLVTRRWTLRETDIYTFQKKLQEIDDLRINGKFPTNSSPDDHGSNRGQSVLLYLLRRCYAIIYKLLESSEPVSESLQPLHNQLSTVRRCLLEVKRMGGVNNSRELYPFQMKLSSLDNLRKDGKFIVDGEIPEGQGTLNALLAECYDIIQEMRIESEERAETESQNNKDDNEDDYSIQNPYDNELYERGDDDEEEEEEEEGEEEEDYNDDEEDEVPNYAASSLIEEATAKLTIQDPK